MIKDPLDPSNHELDNVWTSEELEALSQIKHDLYKLEYDYGTTRVKEAGIEYYKKNHELMRRESELKEQVYQRYKKGFIRNKKRIYEEIQDILDTITKEDYINSVKDAHDTLLILYGDDAEKVLNKLGPDSHMRLMLFESFEGCKEFIALHLVAQLRVVKELRLDRYKANQIIEARVSQWYKKETPVFLQVASGKPTGSIAALTKKDLTVNQITKTAAAELINNVSLTIPNFNKLAAVSINTHKLLTYAVAAFTKQNDFRSIRKGGQINAAVSFPLKEYAKLLGYDIEPHDDTEKEKKRAKNNLDRARRQVKKDLALLLSFSLTWHDEINGKNEPFLGLNLLDAAFIKQGRVTIIFTQSYSYYLARRGLISQYPTKLLSLSAKKDATAYRIGVKLEEYYNIDRNIKRGTNNRIKIETLLKASGLKSFEELQESKDRGHWERAIKEPFENALDTLTRKKLLKNWKYTHEKGKKLTDEEAARIDNYKDFSNLYLLFDPIDKIDHTERITKKEERINKQIKKRKASKKNIKTANKNG